jgi:hypothetical protein
VEWRFAGAFRRHALVALLQVWAFEEEEEEKEKEEALYVRSEPRKRVQIWALPTGTGQGKPSSLSSVNMPAQTQTSMCRQPATALTLLITLAPGNLPCNRLVRFR